MLNREKIEGNASTLTSKEAVKQFPFLRSLQSLGIFIQYSQVIILDDSPAFRNHPLMENESQAEGHGSVRQQLFIIRGKSLHEVEVKRTTRNIYPPTYLHTDQDFPPDEYGESETVGQALSRQDLRNVTYAILHRKGYKGSLELQWSTEENSFNEVFIVPLSQLQE